MKWRSNKTYCIVVDKVHNDFNKVFLIWTYMQVLNMKKYLYTVHSIGLLAAQYCDLYLIRSQSK